MALSIRSRMIRVVASGTEVFESRCKARANTGQTLVCPLNPGMEIKKGQNESFGPFFS